ncbi:hypothetical protein [Corynebacterium crudilactis]|uniref:HpcH/HpaI aldolase/citrate lyase domain-containing protein n=1 Tax=Corynebacterium crudilactis TaxID=1652495 RepID=A0A172QX36_9CORY|nr:hypothetical protein [Corynebacterium crudilactis]ANE05206.1 hypothetical protein ccrud_00475 [Corynebacterium crudilactis]
MPVQQITKFFDDAAIFPPGLAPLQQAVQDHIERQRTATASLVGPFIVPVEKLEEAAAYAGIEQLDVSVILHPREADELVRIAEKHTHLQLSAVELKLEDDGLEEVEAVRGKLASTSIFVELPATLVSADNLELLRAWGAGLKFRTGGIRQELFPTPQQLIDVLQLAIRTGVPFKLTAGLHRAMRYQDEKTGFQHFGFLNIAAAVSVLKSGGVSDEAVHILNSDDAQRVMSVVSGDQAWRDSFRSFGTCSITEPLETLSEIGFIDTPEFDIEG